LMNIDFSIPKSVKIKMKSVIFQIKDST